MNLKINSFYTAGHQKSIKSPSPPLITIIGLTLETSLLVKFKLKLKMKYTYQRTINSRFLNSQNNVFSKKNCEGDKHKSNYWTKLRNLNVEKMLDSFQVADWWGWSFRTRPIPSFFLLFSKVVDGSISETRKTCIYIILCARSTRHSYDTRT